MSLLKEQSRMRSYSSQDGGEKSNNPSKGVRSKNKAQNNTPGPTKQKNGWQ